MEQSHPLSVSISSTQSRGRGRVPTSKLRPAAQIEENDESKIVVSFKSLSNS